MTTDIPRSPSAAGTGALSATRRRFHQFTDVIGELVSLYPPTVRTADGEQVPIDADRIVAMKALGPRPIRIGEIARWRLRRPTAGRV